MRKDADGDCHMSLDPPSDLDPRLRIWTQRTLTFTVTRGLRRRVGVSKGQYFDKHLKFIQLSDDPIAFSRKDLSGLVKAQYDKTLLAEVYDTSTEVRPERARVRCSLKTRLYTALDVSLWAVERIDPALDSPHWQNNGGTYVRVGTRL